MQSELNGELRFVFSLLLGGRLALFAFLLLLRRCKVQALSSSIVLCK